MWRKNPLSFMMMARYREPAAASPDTILACINCGSSDLTELDIDPMPHILYSCNGCGKNSIPLIFEGEEEHRIFLDALGR